MRGPLVRFRGFVVLALALVLLATPVATGSAGQLGGSRAAGSSPPPGPSSLQASYTVPYGPNETCNPDDVTLGFLGVAEGGTAPFSYTWDFGDHSPLGHGGSVQHTYSVWAPPQVTLWIVDSKGANASYMGAPPVQPVWLCSVQSSQAVLIAGVPVADFLLVILAILIAIPILLTVRRSRLRRREGPRTPPR